jgi:hypothetical protein
MKGLRYLLLMMTIKVFFFLNKNGILIRYDSILNFLKMPFAKINGALNKEFVIGKIQSWLDVMEPIVN